MSYNLPNFSSEIHCNNGCMYTISWNVMFDFSSHYENQTVCTIDVDSKISASVSRFNEAFKESAVSVFLCHDVQRSARFPIWPKSNQDRSIVLRALHVVMHSFLCQHLAVPSFFLVAALNFGMQNFSFSLDVYIGGIPNF